MLGSFVETGPANGLNRLFLISAFGDQGTALFMRYKNLDYLVKYCKNRPDERKPDQIRRHFQDCPVCQASLKEFELTLGSVHF